MTIKKTKEIIIKLIKSNSTPQGIAAGVAIGVFIAVLPLYGFHTLMVIISAVLIPGVNKVAILLGTNISLPPTVPFITWGGYEIGRFVLHKNYPPLSGSYFKHLTFQRVKEFYYPLFTGSVILGILCAILFYFITLFFAQRFNKNRP